MKWGWSHENVWGKNGVERGSFPEQKHAWVFRRNSKGNTGECGGQRQITTYRDVQVRLPPYTWLPAPCTPGFTILCSVHDQHALPHPCPSDKLLCIYQTQLDVPPLWKLLDTFELAGVRNSLLGCLSTLNILNCKHLFILYISWQVVKIICWVELLCELKY